MFEPIPTDSTSIGNAAPKRPIPKVWVALLTGLIVLALPVLFTLSTRAEDASGPSSALAPTQFDTPTYSSPITLAANQRDIWSVNPDDDTVSRLVELDGVVEEDFKISVGDEPQSVAIGGFDPIDENHYHLYVANAAENSVTIIDFDNGVDTIVNTLTTGAEPWNIVASPDGERVFVANSGQDTITVIRTDTNEIVGSVNLRDSLCNDPDRNRIFQPRGLAVTLDNDRLFVTRFLSFTRVGGVQGSDDGKEGVVCQLDIPASLDALPTVANVVAIGSQETGFNIDSDGDGEADPTSAFPNQMQSVVIRGNYAYLPNIAASPSKPLKFNADTQAFVNVIRGVASGTPTDVSADKFVNMHLGARDPEAGKEKLFFANPWAIAFTNQSGNGTAYAVSAGSDILVKLNVDAVGKLTFTEDENTTRYIDLNDPSDPATAGTNAGKNPLGIAIAGDRAFIMNDISRNVSVVDLTTDEVIQVVQTGELPAAGSRGEELLLGKEMFFSSRGHFNRPAETLDTTSTENRLSNEGWQNCASCHFAGLTDAVVWQFVPGPRKSIPMNGTWSPHNEFDQRILNYSAVFDEVEDFEINVRNISGPGALAEPIAGSVQDPQHGLIISDTGNINFAPTLINGLGLPNAGRPQHTVSLPGSDVEWPALTALKQWVRFSIRTPNGALTSAELSSEAGGIDVSDVQQGRRLFLRAGCQQCHGGTKWTISNKDFESPIDSAKLANEADAPNNAVPLPFITSSLFDINSFDLGVPGAGNDIGNNVGAVEIAANGKTGLGKDHNGDGEGDGFNIPSLLGISQLPPYYHNGACETLACVLSNEDHRTSGLRQGQSDPLATEAKQAQLVAFLQTLDADTAFPFNLYVDPHDLFTDPPKPFKGTQAIVGANVSLFGTKADLTDLLADSGLTDIKVSIAVSPGLPPVELSLSPDDFGQDFGQAVITTTWDVPADASDERANFSVTVDSDNQLPEDRESDNSAARTVRMRENVQPDTQRPVVTSVAISDDAVFNDADPITVSENVRIKFTATDEGVGLGAFCVVNYKYDVARRRWVEQECTFEDLPEAEAGTTDTFIVDAQIQPTRGILYAFVWVRDKAGNISRRPLFDVITFLPEDLIWLRRNDVMILRLPLSSGNLQLDFDVEYGDIDVSVFDDFTKRDSQRCGLSANNGSTAEQIILPGACPASPGRFQVEIRAVANSSFTVVVDDTVLASVKAAAIQSSNDQLADEAPTTPLVAGPPAGQTAIDDDFADPGVTEGPAGIFLPFVSQ